MKKYLCFLTVFVLLIPFSIRANSTEDISLEITNVEKTLTIHLFKSNTCPHCARELSWLEEYEQENDFLDVKIYEVNEHKDLTSDVRKSLGIKNQYVPLTVIGSDYFVGYSNDIQKQIIAAVKAYKDVQYCDLVLRLVNGEDVKGCRTENNGIYSTSEYRSIPFLGEVNVKNISLPLVAAIVGFVDGFNPCAMWALIFIITLLFDLKDRKKMWILGLGFLIASAVIYLLFMMSWLTVASNLASTWFRFLVAIFALGAAGWNLRKYYKAAKAKTVGCDVTDKKQKTKMAKRAEKIVKEKSIWLSLLGIIGLAFSVYAVEFACTAGLPLLFIQILSMNSLGAFEYGIYLFIYILFFLLTDIIIFAIAMKTLQIKAISNKFTKYSHLIGGIIMLLIGILLMFKPEWIMFNF